MIANYTGDGWEIITQRTHGLLAAQLAGYWNKQQRPEPWTETLLAIAEHDDAEVELDGENLITSQGGPLNYTMKSFDLQHCRKLATLSLTKSRYIALLTSLHMEFLYRRDAKKNETARIFLTDQKRCRKQWQKELGISKMQAEKIYCLMEWFDACSLLLCERKLPPEKRQVEISHGADGTRYQLFQPAKDIVSVLPWPFASNKFTVQFESRKIPGIEFTSSATFRKAFLEAPVTQTILTFKRMPGQVKPKTTSV